MIIQVYAFTRIDQAIQAAQMGVDHIGFIAGRYGLVHGELNFDEARRLVDALHGQAQRVALTMATEVDEILRMADAVGPDIVHISTDPDAVGFGHGRAEKTPASSLRPGVDGVILRDGMRRATFLPQVWEKLPDKAAFLANQLCAKMGVAPDSWRHRHLDVLTYQVEEFHE